MIGFDNQNLFGSRWLQLGTGFIAKPLTRQQKISLADQPQSRGQP
jgi:hypothetical protein